MKKRAIAYEFLLRLILALLFVGTAAFIGMSFFRSTDAAMTSYGKFVTALNDLKDGEYKEIGIDFDRETAIIGFSKDSTQFECHNCLSPSLDGQPRAIFKKPSKPECIGAACICLCRDLEDKDMEDAPTTEFSCNPLSLTCRNLKSSLDIGDFYNAVMEDQPGNKAFWRGGFAYGRDVKALLNNMKNYLPRTRVLRAENYRNFLLLCPAEKKKCLTGEIEKHINEKLSEDRNSNLKKSFEDFTVFLEECGKNADTCGTINFASGYNLYYIPERESERDYGIYLLQQTADPDVERDSVQIEGKLLKLKIILYKGSGNELEKGYIFRNGKAAFTSEDGKVIIAS